MTKQTRQTMVTVAVLTALALGLCVVHVVRTDRYYRSVAPLPHEEIGMLAQRIHLTRVRQCDRDGTTFYMADGETPPGHVLASAPPVYVFDSAGRLVEWIRDSGDEPTRMEPWERLPSREVPLDEVLRSVDRESARRAGPTQ